MSAVRPSVSHTFYSEGKKGKATLFWPEKEDANFLINHKHKKLRITYFPLLHHQIQHSQWKEDCRGCWKSNCLQLMACRRHPLWLARPTRGESASSSKRKTFPFWTEDVLAARLHFIDNSKQWMSVAMLGYVTGHRLHFYRQPKSVNDCCGMWVYIKGHRSGWVCFNDV